jgi:photosystem II stability/assembly factor-like uncharacterized protein
MIKFITTIIVLGFAEVYLLYAQSALVWKELPGPSSEKIVSLVSRNSIVLVSTDTLLYRSFNNGALWQQFTVGSDARTGKLLSSNKMFFLASDTVFRSADNGTTWQPILSLPTTSRTVVSPIVSVVQVPGALVAATWDFKIYQSTDDGQTWQKIITSGLTSSDQILGGTFKAFDSVLIASTVRGILRSTDNGMKWQLTSTNSSDDVVLFGGILCSATRSAGLFAVSSDMGQTWRTITNNAYQFTSSLLVQGNTMLLGCKSGLYRTSLLPANATTATLQPILNGSETYPESRIVQATDNQTVFAIQPSGLLRSQDGGLTWQRTADLKIMSNITLSSVENELIAFAKNRSDRDGRTFISRDGGQTWNFIRWLSGQSWFARASQNYLVQNSGSIYLAPRDSLFTTARFEVIGSSSPTNPCGSGSLVTADGDIAAYQAYCGIFNSVNGGKTFRPTRPYTNGIQSIYSIVVRGRSVFISTDRNLFRSIDGGNTWQSLPSLNNATTFFSGALNESDIFAYNYNSNMGAYIGFYRSNDSGLTWQTMKLPTTTQNIAAMNVQANMLWCRTISADTIYRSFDKGETWYKQPLTFPSGTLLSWHIIRNSIYASIQGRGLFSAELATISSIKEQPINISTLAPNPATDNTKISFTLSKSAAVTITLYSTLGSEILRIEKGIMSVGDCDINIDTHNLQTGVYIYRLNIDGVSNNMGRLMIIK